MIAFLILIILCIIYFVFLYYKIDRDKTAGYSNVENSVLQEGAITKVHEISRFHGDKAYYVVFGEDNSGEKRIVFVPFEKDEELTVVDQQDIVSKEDILEKWQQECTDCKLIRVTPGLIDDNPLWEITYIDSSNRYVFDYLSIYDGSQYEQLRFKKMFN